MYLHLRISAFDKKIMHCFDTEMDDSSIHKYEESLTFATRLGTSVINGVSSPVAFAANALVVVAIIKKPSLHTPSNILLCSLAVTDLLVGLILQPATIIVHNNDAARSSCSTRITVSFIEYFLTCVSFTSLSAISVDRYIVLFYPLRYNSIITLKRYLIITFTIWSLWILLVSFRLFGLSRVFWELLKITWGLGLLITFVVYIRIFLLVRHHRRQIARQQPQLSQFHVDLSEDTSRSSQNTFAKSEAALNCKKQTKAAITMAYVVALFLIFYIPVGVCLIYVKSVGESEETKAAEMWAEAIFYFSSALNPMIFLWRKEEIRKAVKKLLNQSA